MKHPVGDRVVIVLTSLLLLCLVACVVGLLTGLLPLASWDIPGLPNLQAESLTVRVIAWAGSALVFLLAIFNFMIIFPGRKRMDDTYTVQQAENGELRISIKALDHLVEKCFHQHPELTEVTSKITSNQDSVTIDLHVTLSTDINIPMAVTALQKEIKQYLEACSGVHVEEVRVVVDSTAASAQGVDSPFLIPEMMQTKRLLDPAGDAPTSGTASPASSLSAEPEQGTAPKEETPYVSPYTSYGQAAKTPEASAPEAFSFETFTVTQETQADGSDPMESEATLAQDTDPGDSEDKAETTLGDDFWRMKNIAEDAPSVPVESEEEDEA